MIFVAVLTFVILTSNTSRLRAAETRISIGVTKTMETFNPYGDSVSLSPASGARHGLPRHLYFEKGHHVRLLMERWEIKDPNIKVNK